MTTTEMPVPAPGTTTSAVGVEGVRFALRRAEPAKRGSAPTALLLHGVPQTGEMWRELVPLLASDGVVLAPDLKGLGGSEPRPPYDLATMARELAALVLHEIEGLPGDGRVDVVGHDWGGVLALALAAARPDLVRRLVVIDAPYRHIDLMHAFHVPLFQLPLLPELGFLASRGRLARLMVRAGWKSRPGPSPALLRTYGHAYAGSAQVRAMLAYYRSARPGGLWPGAHVVAERVLVLWGAADPALPLPVGQAVLRALLDDLARVGGDPATLEMVTLPGVGHFPVEEAPGTVLPLLTDFLRAP